jgi:uncharacterized protein YbdZ (MbtH family)
MEENDPFEEYCVVVNHEEQYSIWPTDREIPAGWVNVGTTGTKKECLDHIEVVWTDMRPLSLRKQMEERKNNPPPSAEDAFADDEPQLVDRLSQGSHEVVASLRPDRTGEALREAIDRNWVQLKFIGTRGGTEFGMDIDLQASDLTGADFGSSRGAVKLVGNLTLDFIKVRCIAEIDLATLAGHGHLEKVATT